MRCRVIGTAIFCFFLPSSLVPGCCQCVPTFEKTRWGGNMAIEIDDHKPVRGVDGIVQDESGNPVGGTLVEVYDHPENLHRIRSERTEQHRIGGCVTDESGRFLLKVPRGEYELRFSQGSGWDVTSYWVRIRTSPFASRRRLVVSLKLGT